MNFTQGMCDIMSIAWQVLCLLNLFLLPNITFWMTLQSSPHADCQVLWCLDRMRYLYCISLATQKTTHKISLFQKLAKIICDFHTGDARYHVNCMASFVSPRSISAAKNASKEYKNTDPAFDDVIGEILKDKSRL